MSAVLRSLTVEDLETSPDDGRRYEIIAGDLSISPAPHQKHQYTLGLLFRAFDDAARKAKSGQVYFSPVDVRFTNHDQVQPDLIYIRKERAEIYQGHTVLESPDIVVEVLSPTNRSYDEVAKFQLYETYEVPEYWIFDPEKKTARLYELEDGFLKEVAAERSGQLASRQLIGLIIDPIELFRNLDA